MVNKFSVLWMFFSILLCNTLFAEDIQLTAEMNQEIYENEPIKGTISITHNVDNRIDIKSFLLGSDKLNVELAKEIKISPSDPLLLSIYNFTLPAKPQGLYVLPAISVKIGKETHQSIPTSYTVASRKDSISAPAQKTTRQITPQSATKPSTAPSISDPSKKPAAGTFSTSLQPQLRLEALNQGSSSLYPGQRTTFTYRYTFSGDIGLTKEELPLLDAEGFIKIGQKEIQDSVKGALSIREISQQVEAVKPGKFTLGPSLIEGRAYTEDTPGNPVFTSDKLSSSAPALEITVMSFPEKDKPASFNGAVGKFSFKTSLPSALEMTVGDEFPLSLEITGEGNLKNITISNLCCQPGFSGVFSLSDLPPSEEIEGNQKKVIAKFRPLNTLAKAIPSIEFSFFDPETASYVTLHSNPIPISVKPSLSQEKALAKEDALPAVDAKKESIMPEVKSTLAPLEVESIVSLKTCDLYNNIFGSWWALVIVPLGIMLLIYQSHLKEYLNWKRNYGPIYTSKELFQNAFAERKNGKFDFELLKKSFKLALADASLIGTKDIPDEDIPDVGLPKEVKIFWALLDEKRFAGNNTYDVEEIYRLSDDLMNKINVVTKSNEKGVHI